MQKIILSTILTLNNQSVRIDRSCPKKLYILNEKLLNYIKESKIKFIEVCLIKTEDQSEFESTNDLEKITFLEKGKFLRQTNFYYNKEKNEFVLNFNENFFDTITSYPIIIIWVNNSFALIYTFSINNAGDIIFNRFENLIYEKECNCFSCSCQ